MSDELTNHQKQIANLKPAWKKGQSGNPNCINAGRKKSRIKEIEKQDMISSYDVKNVAAYLLGKTIAELQEILNDDNQPAFVVAMASSLLSDGKKGIFIAWQELINRSVGKAEQTVNENVKTIRDLSDEEFEELKRKTVKEELSKMSPEEREEILGGGE